MFKGKRGKWSLVVGLVALVPLYFLVIMPLWQVMYLPEPYLVKLPEFKGRILPSEQVKSGTFTVQEDFELISKWDGSGILSYGPPQTEGPFGENRGLTFMAWRPDPRSPGVFNYAKKDILTPISWSYYHRVGEIERIEGHLKVYPAPNWSGTPLFILGVALTLLVLVIASAINPRFGL